MMSEVVTAEQIEAFRTNGFVVIDDLLTDAELDTFESLVTAAVAYRSAGDERTLEEGGAGGSPVVPAATHAVDENDVLDLGHTTKGDSHSAQASPKRVSVRAAARGGNPPPVRGLHQFAQHTSRITAGRQYLEWRLAVHAPAPPSRIGTGSNLERCRSPESCRACVQDERDGRGIRRQRFCMPPIGIVTAPPTRTWRTW